MKFISSFLRFTSLLVCFLLLSFMLEAKIMVSAEQQKIYEDVFALKFKKAQKGLQDLDPNINNEAINKHIEDWIDFLKVFIGEKKKDYENGLNHRDNRMDYWSSLSDDSPYKNYLIGDSYLRWSLISIKFKEDYRSVKEFRRAYFRLKKNHENFPNFAPSNADLGITKILLGSVPDKYKWITNLINMRGSIVEGTQDIKNAFQQINFKNSLSHLKTPVLFMQGFINLNIDLKQEDDIITLLNAHIKSDLKLQPLFIFLYANIYQKQHNASKAIEILSLYEHSTDSYPFYFLDYMKGLSLLHQLDKHSEIYFKTYIKHFEGNNYINSSYQKLAWNAIIHGDTLSYQKYIKEIDTKNPNITGEDKQAQKEAENKQIPNITLLKSRLLFDGGNFNMSLKILSEGFIDKRNITEKTEYHYRLGRNYHLLKKYTLAKQQYNFAYKYGKALKTYFAANALLKKGEILMEQGQYQQAEEAFNVCLDLKHFDYEWSIHQQCKVELEKIKNKKQ